jgi:hypothetical protein
MSTKDDRKIAEKLFGSVQKIKATGNHKVNVLELIQPLEWEEGVIRAFCEGCGTYVELNQKIAERYAYSAYIKLPENAEKYYFHTKGCALCDSPNAEVKLIPLPNA